METGEKGTRDSNAEGHKLKSDYRCPGNSSGRRQWAAVDARNSFRCTQAKPIALQHDGTKREGLDLRALHGMELE